MKKLYLLISLGVFFTFFLACEGQYNLQESSKEEALYIAQQTQDYTKELFYMNVKVRTNNNTSWPVAFHPSFADTVETGFSHIIMIQKKDGSFWILLLNDDRPPKIVAKARLYFDQEYIYKPDPPSNYQEPNFDN
jgi:hypothetical protein